MIIQTSYIINNNRIVIISIGVDDRYYYIIISVFVTWKHGSVQLLGLYKL